MHLLLLSLSLLACTPADAPPVTDSGTDTSTPADTAPPNAPWRLEPVPGMICADGSPTGIGLSPGSNPARLVVHIDGGGACFDEESCYTIGTAANIEGGYSQAELDLDVASIDDARLYARTDPSSPVYQAELAFLPYCTGDLHIGRAELQYDPQNPRITHHVGDANLQLAVTALHARYPDVTQLWLVGTSAGGFAAQLQADRFAAAWPNAALRVFADSAPMVEAGAARWALWTGTWNPRFPQPLGEATSLPNQLAAQREALPAASFAFAGSKYDRVISIYLGLNPVTLAAEQQDLADQYAADPLAASFLLNTQHHGLLNYPDDWVARDGTTLRAWFDGYLGGQDMPDASARP